MKRILAAAGVVLACAGLGLGAAAGAVSLPASAPTSVGAVTAGAGDFSLPRIGLLAKSAGFRGASLAMAIAVAMAESAGDPNATDFDANGSVDRGLWQINSIHSQYSPACDYDPACAAAAAYGVSDGGGDWDPWVTYRRGDEIAYLPAALAWVETSAAAP